MATKTALQKFKEQVTETLESCIDDYGLADSLCQDGLDDFCSRLGIPLVKPAEKKFYVSLEGSTWARLTDDDAEAFLDKAQTAVNAVANDLNITFGWDQAEISS